MSTCPARQCPARRGGTRLSHHDGGARQRPGGHRRACCGHSASGIGDERRWTMPPSPPAIRPAPSRFSGACNGCWPTWRRRSPAARLLVHHAAVALDTRPIERRSPVPWRNASPRTWPSPRPPTRSRSSAAQWLYQGLRSRAALSRRQDRPRSTKGRTKFSARSSPAHCWLSAISRRSIAARPVSARARSACAVRGYCRSAAPASRRRLRPWRRCRW